MNRVILIGRITKDLELRSTKSDKSVCEFTLATNRPVNRDGEKVADFMTCQVWGKQAENLCKYQGKGSLIAVIGELRTDSYEYEGQKRYKTYVYANEVEFLESKKDIPTEKLTTKTEVQEQIEYTEADLPW